MRIRRQARKARDKELEAQYWALVMQRDAILANLNRLKATRIRVSLPTELGVRPIYDTDIVSAILMTRMAGGNGIVHTEGPTIEVISQWQLAPEVIDEMEGDDATL